MANSIPVQAHTSDALTGPVLKDGVLCRLKPFDVKVTDGSELEQYLANHPDLVPVLEDVCARLRDAFGSDAELSFEFYKDPEQQDQYPVLYVRQTPYEASILNRIETVVTPFMPQLEDASGHFLVTTDFRRARG